LFEELSPTSAGSMPALSSKQSNGSALPLMIAVCGRSALVYVPATGS